MSGTGTSLRDELRHVIATSQFFDDVPPEATSLAGLVAESTREPSVVARYRAYDSVTREAAREAFDRATARGEVRVGADVEMALDLLSGILFARTATGQATPPAQAAEAILDLVLHGIATR